MGSDSDKVDPQVVLEQARLLVKYLEEGDSRNANRAVDFLCQTRETSIFREVGKLARELHERLVNFASDERLHQLAEREIPDATDRLNYVIEKSHDAADRTLNAVEAALPMAQELGARAAGLKARAAGDPELTGFLEDTEARAATIQQHLNDVLMAQEFQDLTGQVIGRVSGIVRDVEESLITLLQFSGWTAEISRDKDKGDKANKPASVSAEGPQIKADAPDVVSGQDDVDDLLSSLGF